MPDAAYFVEDGPEFELRNGLFHIIYRSGEDRLEVVLPPSAFFRGLRRAAEAGRGFHFAAAEVVEFPQGEIAAH